MRLTLLDMVQTILSAMSSDDVNHIGDTLESMQVATAIRTVYFSILDGKDWPHLYKLYQLESSEDIDKPTHMRLPDNVIDVHTIKNVKYNAKRTLDDIDRYTEVKFMEPYDFLRRLDTRRGDDSRVKIVEDDSGIKFNIINNVAPHYYTCFDNVHLIFDSYNAEIEDTLQEIKTSVYGKIQPVWVMEDSFIPDLPPNAFSYLLAEATSWCFISVKEAPNQKAEQYSVSGRRRLSQEAWRVNKGIKFPDYGRKR